LKGAIYSAFFVAVFGKYRKTGLSIGLKMLGVAVEAFKKSTASKKLRISTGFRVQK
jgi:hypothetical protein